MTWNACSTSDWRLYVILDAGVLRGRDVVEVARAAMDGGADVLQYRDKTGSAREMLRQVERLVPVCRDADVPLIVNDHLDIARLAGAAGVHLGQDDLPVAKARMLAGERMWIGQSTHSVEQLERAAAEPVTYIAVGPVFPTPTKPTYDSIGLSLIREAAQRLRHPWLAIGGIDLTNIDQVLEAGATRVAVVRAVAGAEDITSAARAIKQRLREHLVPRSGDH